MSDNTAQQTAPWVQAILDRFETVENVFPDPTWLQGDWPYWVHRVAQEIAKASYPTAHFKVGKKWEVGEVAAIIGQEIAYFDSWTDWMETTKITDKQWTELRKIFGGDFKERALEYARKLTEEYFSEFSDALKFSVSLACEQDYVPMKQFFRAFSKALERRPTSVGDVGSTATRLYWILLVSWRRVEEFGSIPELHRRLCRCVFLGPHVVGPLKRLEKICERVGLSYREIADRKKQATIPDRAVVVVSGDNGAAVSLRSTHANSRTRQQKRATAGADKKTSRRRTRS
jgi:hypothetical protein